MSSIIGMPDFEAGYKEIIAWALLFKDERDNRMYLVSVVAGSFDEAEHKGYNKILQNTDVQDNELEYLEIVFKDKQVCRVPMGANADTYTANQDDRNERMLREERNIDKKSKLKSFNNVIKKL